MFASKPYVSDIVHQINLQGYTPPNPILAADLAPQGNEVPGSAGLAESSQDGCLQQIERLQQTGQLSRELAMQLAGLAETGQLSPDLAQQIAVMAEQMPKPSSE